MYEQGTNVRTYQHKYPRLQDRFLMIELFLLIILQVELKIERKKKIKRKEENEKMKK